MTHLNRIQARGPISEKFIIAAKQSMQKISNIFDLTSFQTQKEYSKQEHTLATFKNYTKDPLYAVFLMTKHVLTSLTQVFSSESTESERLSRREREAGDLYMPSYPPMSPITDSYFEYWALLDMAVGVKKETYGTIVLDFMREMCPGSEFIPYLDTMQSSRMGFYCVERRDGNFVYLREVNTTTVHKVYAASGHINPRQGELWLTRLFMDPLHQHDYAISAITPYVIINSPGHNKPINPATLFYPEKLWVEFIQRNLTKIPIANLAFAYTHFMKYGLSKFYWLEYIFCAYVNHTDKFILLAGFPDRPKTLPFSDLYRNK